MASAEKRQEYLKFKCVDEFHDHAMKELPVDVGQYINSASGQKFNLEHNCQAFKRYLIRPCALVDGSVEPDTTTTVLGQRVNSPISIANTGNQKVAHPDGELASCIAAASAGVLFGLSTFSTTSMEEIAEVPNCLKWFQLTFHPDKGVCEDMVRRAEKAGFQGIIFAGDPSEVGKSFHFELPPHLSNPIYKPYGGEGNVENDTLSLASKNVTWKDAAWLRSITKLPLILKGVMTKEDALLAVHYGIDGIIVSNWGGRRMDGVPATIDVLEEVLQAVEGRAEVYLDSGIRSGVDAFKALALGARAVFVGRPVFWALKCGGEKAVERLLVIMNEELKGAMKLSGCKRITDIRPSMITRQCSL